MRKSCLHSDYRGRETRTPTALCSILCMVFWLPRTNESSHVYYVLTTMINDASTSRLRCPSSVGEGAWCAYARRQPLLDLCPAARYDGQTFYRASPALNLASRCSLITIGSLAGRVILNVRVEDGDRVLASVFSCFIDLVRGSGGNNSVLEYRPTMEVYQKDAHPKVYL